MNKFHSLSLRHAIIALSAIAGVVSCVKNEEETPLPTVELTSKSSTETSLTFNLKPTDANQAYYMTLKKGETIPEAEVILEDGTPADATKEKEYTVSNLVPYTEYTIVAVASNKTGISPIAEVSITTAIPTPVINLLAGEVGENTVSFKVIVENAGKAAWLCLPATEEAPSAEKIIQDGTAITTSGEECHVDGLTAGTEYKVYAAANDLSENNPVAAEPLALKTKEIKAPEVGDFYYSDGTWSTELNPEKTPIAIVFYTGAATDYNDRDEFYKMKDGSTPLGTIKAYAVAIKDATSLNGSDELANWSFFDSYYEGAGTSSQLNDFLGYTNSISIQKASLQRPGALTANDDSFPAAYYALVAQEEAHPAPEKSSGWFLPSAYQFKYIYDNVYFNDQGTANVWLEKSFETLGDKAQPLYRSGAEYWTSTEKYDSSGCSYWAYYFCFDSSNFRPGFIADYRKNSGMCVRSMIVF